VTSLSLPSHEHYKQIFLEPGHSSGSFEALEIAQLVAPPRRRKPCITMKATGNGSSTKKHIATYGKANGKRLLTTVVRTTFDVSASASNAPLSRPATHESMYHEEFARSSDYPSDQKDIFEVESSSDEAVDVPRKRPRLLPSKAVKEDAGVGRFDTKGPTLNHGITRGEPASHATSPKPPTHKRRLGRSTTPPDQRQRAGSRNTSDRMQKTQKTQPKPPQGIDDPDCLQVSRQRFQRSTHTASTFMTTTNVTNSGPAGVLQVPEAQRGSPHIQHVSPPSERKSSPSVADDRATVTTAPLSSTLLTPKVKKMWDGLLSHEDRAIEKPQVFPSPAKFTQAEKKPPFLGALDRRLPRRRLIDSFAEPANRQDIHSDTDSASETECFQPANIPVDHFTTPAAQPPLVRSTSTSTLSADSAPIGAGATSGQSGQKVGARITYSRQRSMLAEHELIQDANFDIPLTEEMPAMRPQNRPGFSKVPDTVPEACMDAEEEAANGLAIQTMHELRHAGAQSRFKFEVEDMLERIGTPARQNNGRRSGLIDLAGRMFNRVFVSDFLNSGMDHHLFSRISEEEDPISSFLILAILLIALDHGMTPIAINQLRQQGISPFLTKQLGVEESILLVSKHRQLNLSKSARVLLAEVHQKLTGMRLWGDVQPDSITPRKAALRCLQSLQLRSKSKHGLGDLVSEQLIAQLFRIARLGGGESKILTGGDPHLALTILESHSQDSISTIDAFLPDLKDLLLTALEGSPDPVLFTLLLRIAVNMSNYSLTAADYFASSDFLHLLCKSVVTRFKDLTAPSVDADVTGMVDELVLMLVMIINIVELSVAARQSFAQVPERTLNDLSQIFLDTYDRASEVWKAHHLTSHTDLA
jgi:hypothetical protein